MSSSRRVNDNVVRRGEGGAETLACAHCEQELAGVADDYLTKLPFYEGPVSDAGPHIFPDPSVYIDNPIVFRQYYCPGCYTAFHSEVVPADHAEWLGRATG